MNSKESICIHERKLEFQKEEMVSFEFPKLYKIAKKLNLMQKKIHPNYKLLLRDVLVIPALGMVKSKDCHVFKAILGYTVNFRLV